MSIQVRLDSPVIETQLTIGTLNIETVKGKEIFSFEFSDEAINHPLCANLNPDTCCLG